MTITMKETMRSKPVFPDITYPMLTYHLGSKAADFLGLTREIRKGEWRGKGQKLKKGEHEPGVLATKRAVSIWWKEGAIVVYLDLYRCEENQDVDDCVIVGVRIIDWPPFDTIRELLKLWDLNSVSAVVGSRLKWLEVNPGYRKVTPKTTVKSRLAARDE